MSMIFLYLQDVTPDTSAYMYAGYAVIFGVLIIYLASLVIRQRNLKRDAEFLKELEERKVRKG